MSNSEVLDYLTEYVPLYISYIFQTLSDFFLSPAIFPFVVIALAILVFNLFFRLIDGDF